MTLTEKHEWELMPESLALLLTSDIPVRLIDVREIHEYHFCKIDGAELIAMGQLAIAEKSFNKDDYLVFYCHHGIRSAHALNYFYQQGYRNISHLKGGIDAWSLDVDSNTPRY